MRRAISTICLLLAACSSEPEPLPADPIEPVVLFDGSQTDRVCAELEEAGIENVVRDAFCVTPRPQIDSLRELQRALNVGCPDATNEGQPYTDPFAPMVVPLPENVFACDSLAVTFMSSSLVMRQTSPINPRVILFRDDELGFRSMAFVRGEHFVEFIAENRNAPSEETALNFFVFRFKQACTEAGSCTNADLFSSRIESSWTGVAVQSETDLENTPLDCLQCHTSGEPNMPTRPSLLFQEIERPWAHWMSPLGFDINEEANFISMGFETELPNKRAFVDAHPYDEIYAGVPVGIMLTRIAPARLESTMRDLGFGDGFNPDADTSDSRVDESRFRRLSFEELQGLNEAGLTIQPPTKRSGDLMEPAKKAAAIAGFVAFREGTADDLPNPSDVFATGHAEEYERLSLRARPGATGEEIIRQACTQCHNSYLNSSLTRARFNASALESMSTDILRLAKHRIGLSLDTYGVMPPARLRRLGPEERQRAQDYLQSLIDAR